ncbi:MAG: DUF3300 domain-containing protein [Achromobacter sp.]|uniref:DUF3300 domain-containing protein n=1 Tax=Achromobacter sp. TaxID=134375 RepID=UPI00258CE162|nr:DUF3300 domain-containing protein [Achromobacter sp.]MCW0206026.1 DUF3300 domain-containing protein [Achromobacter sp.]
MRRLQRWFIGWLCLGLAACLPAVAQTKLGNAQLDQLMAPVALYPDSLLSQVLMAATYPDDVAAAAKWSAAHASESGDAAVKAVEGEAWDPSVKSLVAFPSVMDMMGRQPDWVKSLGDAFLAQPDAVMDSAQRLRVQAQNAGNLKSTSQQKVTSSTTNDKTVVVIQPADPQVVYVPSYNPSVVYGTWAYPSYPPYYYPPPPGSVFATSLVAGIGFGLGVAAVNSMWGGFDWGHNDVDIDVNRYNNINVNQRIDRTNVNNNKVAWQHNAANRGNTPYADQASRQRFDGQRQAGLQNRPQQQPGQTGRTPAPGSRDAARERAAQSFEGRTGQAIPGHAQPGAGRGQGAAGREQAGGAGRGQGQAHQAGQGARERPQGGTQAQRDGASSVSTQDRQAAAQRQRADESAARNRARASNSTSALSDAGNGERMRQQSHRGEVGRGGEGGVQRGGGGHMGGGRGGGGGGGGGHFGGRR